MRLSEQQHRPRSKAGVVLALILVFGLAGCATNPMLPLSWSNNTTPEGKFGVVVLGQGTDWGQDDLSYSLITGCSFFSTRWQPMDNPAPKIVSKGIDANNAGCREGNSRIGYNVFRLPPGRYALQQVTHLKQRTYFTDVVFAPVENPAFDQLRTPKFTVFEGEIIYLGDLIFGPPYGANDKVVPTRVRLKSIEKNPAAAREVLARFKIDPAAMIERPAL